MRGHGPSRYRAQAVVTIPAITEEKAEMTHVDILSCAEGPVN